jgi:predicted ATPase
LTSLIGRDSELETIKARLVEHRLVTLTGSGGVGKTRLAIATGTMLETLFPDGVWFAELASLNDPQLVPSVIAEVLRGSVGGGKASAEEVVGALRDKHLLLIIDNCEHIVAEVSRTAELLLRKCPRISILATSREPLTISGESVFPVPSLPTPDAATPLSGAAAGAYPAIRLFVERAESISSSTTAMPRSSARSAVGSTGYRWPSSSPRRGSRFFHCNSWHAGSTIGFGC